ncbi:hypothetical protein QUF80_19675 [Desulfococcaceae bacterium HSG8]|nr:hypothetical protein [Desulfococcaceae bacterium HSG8]
MKTESVHLNEDQLICAVVDESDLTVAVRNHLFACPACQNEKQQFEQELKILGHMAEKFVPLHRKAVSSLPERQGFWKNVFLSPVKWPRFAAGLTVILLMVGIWGSPQFETGYEEEIVQTAWESDEDQQMTTDIRVLEGYTLPEFYLDVSGETYGYFDEEFLEFVAPLEENQIHSEVIITDSVA